MYIYIYVEREIDLLQELSHLTMESGKSQDLQDEKAS